MLIITFVLSICVIHNFCYELCYCSSFKLFLELEPQLRDIIFKFYESKYASCLKLLDEIKVRFKDFFFFFFFFILIYFLKFIL